MNFAAVLFVGGESRRMGTDKATLFFENEPLWQRQLATLKKTLPEKILISARTKPIWCPPDLATVLDVSPTRGPLSGLAAALKETTTTHLLILAVDMPLMTATHLNWLKTHAVLGSGVVPKVQNYSEPLCAIYPAEACELAHAQLQTNDFSLTTFVKKLREQNRLLELEIPAADELVYSNANTPAAFSSIAANANVA